MAARGTREPPQALISALLMVSEYLLAYLAVFVLRRRRPDAPRPYQAGSSLFLADVTAAYTRQLQQKLHLVLVNAQTGKVKMGQKPLLR